MTETERIKDQLTRAFEGHAWHGPSVREVLKGVDEESAAKRPVPGGHTIWELVHHMAAWTDVVAARIQGNPMKEPAAGDFPATANPTAEAWKKSLDWLEESYAQLHTALAALPDSKLDELAAGASKASIYGTVHGAIQHYLYHAGQIAVLKKL